jgi:hypothetical protein
MASDAEVWSDRKPSVDPLGPLISASRSLAVLVVGALLVATVSTVFGSGSVLTIGEDAICANAVAGRDVPGAAQGGETGVFRGLSPGVRVGADVFHLCQENPSAAERVLGFLSVAPPMILLLGFLAGVLIVVRRARRHRLFSRAVAQAVQVLAWFVVIGMVLGSIVQALATSALVHGMYANHDVLDFSGFWELSIPTILAGAGLLTIARMLRMAVDLQNDLDATI